MDGMEALLHSLSLLSKKTFRNSGNLIGAASGESYQLNISGLTVNVEEQSTHFLMMRMRRIQ